jgi:ubiquinone/menaquinone biosynthesis C-methylase UbiE
MVKRVFGNRLLNDRISIKPDDKIADIGTGSGSWALDLAHESPSSITIQACDLNLNVPKSASVPPNIHFSTQSVLALPESWSSTFAVVHQRLFIFALTVPQWEQALAELYRVTKPGGYLQIVELETRLRLPQHPKAVGAHDKMFDIVSRTINGLGLRWDLIDLLPSLVERAGFKDVREEVRVAPWAGGKAERSGPGAALKDDAVKNAVTFVKTVQSKVVAAGYASDAEYERMLGQMAKEWDECEDLAWGQPWHCITAQRPL